jgi:xylose dehydrogenase (NAD/NADP)
MEKVRWGLISTARINRRLIPAIRASQRGVLAAVASRDLAKAQAYATEWGIPKAFGGYQEMLDSREVDAVYVSLPNHLHAEWSIKALRAGVHVLCEKPFAPSLEEVDSMIAASRESGVALAEAFMYRHHLQTKAAGEWVRSGRLGEVSLVKGVFTFRLRNPGDVRMIPEYGGGCLWDVGIYPLSFAQYLYGGPPEDVFGMQVIGETGVDEVFAGTMHYPGGGIAQIASSFRTPYTTSIEIIGSEGSLSLDRPFTFIEDGRMVFTPDKGRSQRIKIAHHDLYSGEVEDLQAAILDGASPYLSLEETRNHIRTALALYESAREGTVVTL